MMALNVSRKTLFACFMAVFKLIVMMDHAYDLVDDCRHAWHAVAVVFSVGESALDPVRKPVVPDKKRTRQLARALLSLVAVIGRNWKKYRAIAMANICWQA